MRKQVVYEWCIETKDEHGDIIDSNFQDILSDLSKPESNEGLVLVRHEGNERQGNTDTVWAYVVDGKLPEYFADGMNTPVGAKVPERFKMELSAYLTHP